MGICYPPQYGLSCLVEVVLHIILSYGCLFLLHNENPDYSFRFSLEGYSEITNRITVLKILQGAPFRKPSTKFSLCGFPETCPGN